MRLLLEKLVQYWQFRIAVLVGSVVLTVGAVLIPVHDDASINQPTRTLTTGLLVTDDNELSDPLAGTSSHRSGVITVAARSSLGRMVAPIWVGENREAAQRFLHAAQQVEESDLPRDFSESIRGLRGAASRGDAAAEYLLGHAYEQGFGVPKDMTEAAAWFARAGVQAGSRADAGAITLNAALDRYRVTAERGDEAAQLYMGLASDLGRDLPRSASQAAAWYRRAALQGSGSAAVNLGVLYRNGDGMPRDSVEAVKWFRQAASQGNGSGEYSLGRMYLLGDGISGNDEEAAHWLEKAAGQGNSPAQILLAAMYATGRGVEGSTGVAYMWLNLASASDERARQSRDEVEKLVSSDELNEGQRLTHAWLTGRRGPMTAASTVAVATAPKSAGGTR